MAWLLWTLVASVQADELTRMPSSLEDLIYANIAADLYNEKACKAPSPTDFIFIWTDKPEFCLRPDEDAFIPSSYEAYCEGRRIEMSQEFRRVWHMYKKKAWGYDSFNPVTGEGNDDRGGIGFFIYDNLDSLYLMGTEDEFLDAVDYIKKNSIVRDQSLRTGPLIGNVLGGLLSAYDLSGNYDVGNITVKLGDLLLEAYSHKDENLPNTLFNLETKAGSSPTYKLQVSELSQWSEFYRLYQITGDDRYLETINRMVQYLYDYHPRYHSLPPYVSTLDVKRRKSRFSGSLSVDWQGSATYRNLYNAWRQMGQNNTKISDIYDLSKQFILKNLTLQMKDGGFFTAERADNETLLYRMHASACMWPGQLALDSLQRYNLSELALANKLIETCVQMYRSSKAGVPPTYTYFSPEGPYYYEEFMGYRLFPDLFESFFHQFRATHDSVYRTAAYYLYKAVLRAAGIENGFSGVTDVNVVPPEHDNQMPSAFTARALKYLFLLFSDVIPTQDLVLPSSEYVFSPHGHIYLVKSDA